MTIALVLLAVFFLYGALSTYTYEHELVGKVGETIARINIDLFGPIAYVDFPLLLLMIFLIMRYPSLRERLEYYLGFLLLFLALLTLQAVVVDGQNMGFLSMEIALLMKPTIGIAGMWLLFGLFGALSLYYLFAGGLTLPQFNLKFGGFWAKLVALPTALSGGMRRIRLNPFANSSDDFLAPQMPPPKKRKPAKTAPKSASSKSPRPETKSASDQESIKSPQATKPISNSSEQEELIPLDEEVVVASQEGSHSTTLVSELEENKEFLSSLEKGEIEKPKDFKLPKLSFLQAPPKSTKKVNEAEIDRKIEDLLDKLKQFNIQGDVVRTYSGPLVTTFEFKPAPNVKVSKILNLQDDLAMALSAKTIRIQAPIPGRDVVGIEIPNATTETIYLREILESDLFQNSASPLTVALGKDIVGNPFVTDIKKLPHLLIAGTTGSGKSVGINAMILSLLYRNDPDHLKLMLIDPKMLEFASYEDIPHLITPVITEPGKAIAALANMVGEMERRYKLMAKARTKNIENYNEKAKKEGFEPFPYIVVIIDELADLMMSGGKDVELSIARLAQKSRACGIHLIVATQRPSVDVVTGLIKANLPSRLAYRVGSKIDSKVILDTVGAESLLGRGDGLFTPPGSPAIVRIHAPWNSEAEIEKVVAFIKAQRVPVYDESYLELSDDGGSAGASAAGEMELDPLYEQAKEVVLSDKKTSISYLQRKLGIGYNRAANLIEQLEAMGVLSPPNSKGQREIL